MSFLVLVTLPYLCFPLTSMFISALYISYCTFHLTPYFYLTFKCPFVFISPLSFFFLSPLPLSSVISLSALISFLHVSSFLPLQSPFLQCHFHSPLVYSSLSPLIVMEDSSPHLQIATTILPLICTSQDLKVSLNGV